MKKLIMLLVLLVTPLLSFTTQESKPNTINTVDKDTVNISISVANQSHANKIDNLQRALTQSINNQSSVSKSIIETLTDFTPIASAYIKEIEKRNKSDGELITEKLNYTTTKIESIIRIQRTLNLITYLIVILYLGYLSIYKVWTYGDGKPWPILLIQLLLFTVIGFVGYFCISNVLTLLWNHEYYMLQELIALYT